MTTTLTESPRSWSFVLSEANGNYSRENGVVASGQGVLVAGTVVAISGGKLIEWIGGDAVGVIGEGVDATSEDVDVAYLARDAEVNLRLLTYSGGSPTTEAQVTAALLSLGIVVRS